MTNHRGRGRRPGRTLTLGAANVLDDLFDHEGHLRTSTLVVQHSHIFEAHEGVENLARVGQDKGVFCLFSHNYN